MHDVWRSSAILQRVMARNPSQPLTEGELMGASGLSRHEMRAGMDELEATLEVERRGTGDRKRWQLTQAA